MADMKHELARCLLVENQALGNWLGLCEWYYADEICEQMYLDALGYGINGRRRTI